MISIRYKNLTPGMHAEAVSEAGHIIVYLVPGLTPAQRKAALRRLRQEGNRGCGPYLPPGQLAVALAVDQLRTGVWSTASAVRHHPVGTLVPAILACGLIGGFVSASMYAQVETASPASAPGGAASWSVPAGPHHAGHPHAPSAGAATTTALPTP